MKCMVDWTIQAHKTEKALEGIGTGLGTVGQDEFAFNEEWHSEDKDLRTRIRRLDGILFQEESKGWKSAYEYNGVVVKWVRQTQQIRLGTNIGKELCTLT